MTYRAHPYRIQRSRRAGWRLPVDAVYVGRPTIWGNPWTVQKAIESRLFQVEKVHQVIVDEYRAWLTKGISPHLEHLGIYHTLAERRTNILEAIWELGGLRLACWCPLDRPCHADVLAELANSSGVE